MDSCTKGFEKHKRRKKGEQIMLCSFIIPTHNNEGEIDQCLESLRLLTGDLEFIVVDDGSTDGTSSICDGFSMKDNRFQVIHQDCKGVSVARNIGLERAKGDWIFFVDGDDYIYTDVVENRILPALDESYDIIYYQHDGMVGNSICKANRETEIRIIRGAEIRDLACRIIYGGYKGLQIPPGARWSFRTPWGKVYRRSFLQSNSLWFPPGVIRSEDNLLNCQAAFHIQSAMMIPAVGYVHRGRIGRPYPYNPHLMESDRLLLEEHKKVFQDCSDEKILKCAETWRAAHVIAMQRLEFCNAGNPGSFGERRRAMIQYTENETIHKALDSLRPGDLTPDKMFIIWLVRYHFFFTLNVYYRHRSIQIFVSRIQRRMKR